MFAPHRRPILSLLAAGIVSQVGNVLTLLAIPWFVLQTTGSASKTGLTGFVIALPMIIAGIFGGVLVDRIGFKRMSILADLASGATVALIPILYLTIGLEFWQLLALAFLGALLDAPGMTARRSLYPELAELAGMPLERANAIEQSATRLSFLIGAPLAGVIIAAIGSANTLLLDAGTFAISALIVAAAIPGNIGGDVDTKPETGYFSDLIEGFQFLRRDSLMLWLGLQVAVMNFLDAIVSMIQPIYAERVYGSAVDLGLMLGASGAGALVTLFGYSALAGRLPRRETYIGSFIVAGLPLFAFILTPPIAVLVVAQFVRGLGAGPLNPILHTVQQERLPRAIRGRVLGLFTAVAWVTMPLGRLISGYLIDGVGLIPTVTAVSIAYVAVTSSLFLVPAYREMNRPRAGHEQPQPAS